MIINRSCDRCGKPYEAKSRRSRYCSGACKTAASRAGGSVVPIRPGRPEHDGPNVTARRAELEALGCADTGDAAQVLTLAARLDGSAHETGNSAASLSREIRALMVEIRASARPASAIDELRDWRDRTRASIG